MCTCIEWIVLVWVLYHDRWVPGQPTPPGCGRNGNGNGNGNGNEDENEGDR